MTDVDQLLPEACDDLGRQAPHDPDLTGSVRRRARRQARRAAAVGTSVIGVLAVAALSVALTTSRNDVPAANPGPGPGPLVAVSCTVDDGVLPQWAWIGFSEPSPRIAHVLGQRGDITAILFAQPLYAPTPPPGRGNKVLWVGRVAGAGDLVIDASLPGTNRHVRQVVTGGPGPSTVDLPVPGCWRFDLRWGDYTDTLTLNYVTAG